jgi:hypothetical protein
VPKTPGAIAAKVHQIYELARRSDTPLLVLNLQGTILMANRDWEPHEIEAVNAEVLDLLIKNGWRRGPVATSLP